MLCTACEFNEAVKGHEYCKSCLKAYGKQKRKEKDEARAERQKQRKRLYDKVQRCRASYHMAMSLKSRWDYKTDQMPTNEQARRNICANLRKAGRLVKDREEKLKKAQDAFKEFDRAVHS